MTDILQALDAALATGGGLEEVVGAFYSLARTSDDATRGHMLDALDRRIAAHPGEHLVDVAMLAGALVEIGADPRRFPASVFDRLLVELEKVHGDDYELPAFYYAFEQAAMAALSRSPELRRDLPTKNRLLSRIQRYQERYGFLGKMLTVLDGEPILVVHPATTRAFRFVVHGVADNFQLHLLLLGALAGAGDDRIEGRAPSTEALLAATDGHAETDPKAYSDWQLAGWRGLRFGAAFVDMANSQHWIWNEGFPAEIEPFEGDRIVLVGASTIARSWNAQRVFDGMPGRLVANGRLSSEETRSLIERMTRRAVESAPS